MAQANSVSGSTNSFKNYKFSINNNNQANSFNSNGLLETTSSYVVPHITISRSRRRQRSNDHYGDDGSYASSRSTQRRDSFLSPYNNSRRSSFSSSNSSNSSNSSYSSDSSNYFNSFNSSNSADSSQNAENAEIIRLEDIGWKLVRNNRNGDAILIEGYQMNRFRVNHDKSINYKCRNKQCKVYFYFYH